jgi:sortase A
MRRDKRTVDELSIEELEQILAIRKREERMKRFRDGQTKERTMAVPLPTAPEMIADNGEDMPARSMVPIAPAGAILQQHEASAIVAPLEAPLTYDITQEKPYFEDEIIESDEVAFIEEAPRPAPVKNRVVKISTAEDIPEWRKYANRALLVVEILAVFGLGYILYRAFIGLDIIQDNTNKTQQEYEAAANERRATATPVPDLYPASLVLPGGHTAEGLFNEDELASALNAKQIPAYLQSNVIQQAQVAKRVETSLQHPISLTIPDIELNNASIFSGDDWETLQRGIGHMIGSGLPGSQQNVVLTGHNDIYGEIFRDLSKLKIGDMIYVRAGDGKEYIYEVKESREVEPTFIEVLRPDRGPVVTLITCHPYQVDTHRWVVTAELVQ